MASLRQKKLKSGNYIWVIEYRLDGKSKTYSLGSTDRHTAQRLYHEFCAKLLDVEPGQTPDKPFDVKGEKHRREAREHKAKLHEFSKLRIPDLEREYMAFSRANKTENTCEIIQQGFWKFREYADDVPLENVNYQIAEGYKTWLLQRLNGTTTNMYHRAVKAGFEYAVKLEWLVKNPFRGVKPVRIPEPDYAVYLNEEEVAQLLSVITNEEFRRLIRFFLLTGCRRTEVALIDWRDIDLEMRTIILRASNTKTKRNRVLEIGEKLFELLQEQGPKKSGRLFPKWTANSITVIFKKYVNLCDFGRKITVHSLRHTATVYFLKAGIDMFTVSRILGHTSVRTTETVYAHIPTGRKREAMDKLPF